MPRKLTNVDDAPSDVAENPASQTSRAPTSRPPKLPARGPQMSSLNPVSVRSRRRAPRAARLGACLLLFLSLAGVARAADDAHALSGGDARRAEKILARLRLLHGAADAVDAAAYRSLAASFYPGLFVEVAELRPGDLSTDLSTAVFLCEELGRRWFEAGAATADCRGERPDIYLPLCSALRGGTVRQLLLAKSRLHARWAEAVLRYHRGEADAGTAHALAEMKAARSNDLLIAARVVEALRPLEALSRPAQSEAAREARSAASAADSGDHDAESEEALGRAGALLAWMPRSRAFYQLSGARAAYADGLWWRGKASRSRRLVVSVNGYAPDRDERPRLGAEHVSAAAESNLKSAAAYTRLAEQSLPRSALAPAAGGGNDASGRLPARPRLP